MASARAFGGVRQLGRVAVLAVLVLSCRERDPCSGLALDDRSLGTPSPMTLVAPYNAFVPADDAGAVREIKKGTVVVREGEALTAARLEALRFYCASERLRR